MLQHIQQQKRQMRRKEMLDYLHKITWWHNRLWCFLGYPAPRPIHAARHLHQKDFPRPITWIRCSYGRQVEVLQDLSTAARLSTSPTMQVSIEAVRIAKLE